MNANSTSHARVEPRRSWSLRRTVLRGTMPPPNRSRPVAPVRAERSSRPGGREIDPAGDARRSMLLMAPHASASGHHRRSPVSDGGSRSKVATTGMRAALGAPTTARHPRAAGDGRRRATSGHRPPAGSRWASRDRARSEPAADGRWASTPGCAHTFAAPDRSVRWEDASGGPNPVDRTGHRATGPPGWAGPGPQVVGSCSDQSVLVQRPMPKRVVTEELRRCTEK